jgi:hypothetical protein
MDNVWNNILHCSCTGNCTKDNIAEINKLVLVNPNCEMPNFTMPPWNDTILVTPQNGSRTLWNTVALCDHCHTTGHTHSVLYTCDTCDGQHLSTKQCMAITHLKSENKVEMAVGMKAMVLLNLTPNANLVNGTRGTIIDIILDPRETTTDDGSDTVFLEHPPAVILFKPYNTSNLTLPELPLGVLPLFPSCKKFMLAGKAKTVVQREQYPITPAYAFTNFKSQGQMIECVLVDLGKPPTGCLTSFNAYVALSRSCGWKRIRLLQNVDERLFTTHPSQELCKEDECLATLAGHTFKCYHTGDFGQFGMSLHCTYPVRALTVIVP